MATAQNIKPVDTSNSTTQKYFNNYFLNVGTISGGRNDAIVGYLERVTDGNKAAAQALASAIIYTSLAQGMDPMKILDQFIKLPREQVNPYLTMFLNLNIRY